MRTRLEEIRDEFVDCVVENLKEDEGEIGSLSVGTVAAVLDRCFGGMADAVVSASMPARFDSLFPRVRRDVTRDSIERQIEKVTDELFEVEVEREALSAAPKIEPADLYQLALEAGDVVVASVTLLRMIADRMGTTLAQVLTAVHEKNSDRGYYETPVTITVHSTSSNAAEGVRA